MYIKHMTRRSDRTLTFSSACCVFACHLVNIYTAICMWNDSELKTWLSPKHDFSSSARTMLRSSCHEPQTVMKLFLWNIQVIHLTFVVSLMFWVRVNSASWQHVKKLSVVIYLLVPSRENTRCETILIPSFCPWDSSSVFPVYTCMS
jgi:hypothetical protein